MMMTSSASAALLALTVAVVVSHAGRSCLALRSSSWSQKHIVTSFWVDPDVPSSEFVEAYEDIAAANFTTLLGFQPLSISDRKLQVDACNKVGIDCIINVDSDEPSQLPQAAGYRLYDEPSTAVFPTLAKQVASVIDAHPNSLAFINLLPTYAVPSQLGAPNYTQYLEDYVSIVKPQFLCMDHYPTMEPNSNTQGAYCENLAYLRQFGLAHSIPWWNFFNTMPFQQHSDPTEAQLRWQVFASLAYGGKGVLYFCYWTPKGAPFVRGGAIITPVASDADDGAVRYIKGPHYAHAKAINSVVAAWSPWLVVSNSSGVYRVLPTSDPASTLKGCPLSDVSPGSNLLIGSMRHPSGTLVMVVNWDYGYTAWPQLTFTVPDSDVREIDPVHGTAEPLLDDSPLMPGLDQRIQPGGARLYYLPA